jgi:hypothetical protein
MTARYLVTVLLVSLLAGCSQTLLQVRCDPPVEFSDASILADPSHVLTSATVLACGLPVAVSVDVATSGETVTICVTPPGFGAICHEVAP